MHAESFDQDLLKQHMELFKNEHDYNINNLTIKLNNKSLAYERLLENYNNHLKEMEYLKSEFKKLKKDMKYYLCQKDEKIKALEKNNLGLKRKFNEDRDKMEINISKLNNEHARISSDNLELKQQLSLANETMKKLQIQNEETYRETFENFTKSLVSMNKDQYQNELPQLNFQSNKNLQNLEKENCDLKNQISYLRNLTDKNYLMVTENENLRNQSKILEDLCQTKLPQITRQCESMKIELESWDKLVNKIILSDKIPKLIIPENLKSSFEKVSYILNELFSQTELKNSETQRLTNKINTLVDRLEAQEKQIQNLSVDLDESKLHYKHTLTAIKYFRENLTKIKPRCEKLHNFLENRSIIPRGHSEYENFKDTFLIIDNMINFPRTSEEMIEKQLH